MGISIPIATEPLSSSQVQPGSGNLTVPPLILQAKQIREAVNFKAGVTDADVSDFFDDA
jgi:hypothetical protein